MSAYPLLETLDDPADLRRLDRKQLARLGVELRAFIVDSVAATGGHLSSNLGTVELTIALHYVFDTPRDRLIWDVGHQTYGHKILTGRRSGMKRLRQKGGIAGFPRREERGHGLRGAEQREAGRRQRDRDPERQRHVDLGERRRPQQLPREADVGPLLRRHAQDRGEGARGRAPAEGLRQ